MGDVGAHGVSVSLSWLQVAGAARPAAERGVGVKEGPVLLVLWRRQGCQRRRASLSVLCREAASIGVGVPARPCSPGLPVLEVVEDGSVEGLEDQGRRRGIHAPTGLASGKQTTRFLSSAFLPS